MSGNWAFLLDGQEYRTEGYFTKEELNAIVEEYKQRILKGYPKIKQAKLIDRLAEGQEEGWFSVKESMRVLLEILKQAKEC